MNTPQDDTKQPNIAAHPSLAGYVTGFVLSICLTVIAYLSVVKHLYHRQALLGLVVVLAVTQFIVQLKYFLHIDTEPKPRWKLFVFWLMLLVVLILVFGSLWIMTNLNYHMSQSQINSYLHSQDGL